VSHGSEETVEKAFSYNQFRRGRV